MKITRRIGLGTLLLALTFCEVALGFQQATIRFDSQNPFLPGQQQRGEFAAYEGIQDQPNPNRRISLINAFLGDYPTSEFRHLVLRARWEVRIEQGDPEEIIEAAEGGLEAQEHFRAAKLEFISDPSRYPGLQEFSFRIATQKTAFYQSIVEAYRDLEDFEEMVEYGELGITAAAAAWNLYDGIADEGTPEYQAALEQNQGFQLFILFNILQGYEADNDVPKIIEFSERVLEVNPDDFETLMTTSLLMAQQASQDGSDVTAYMQRARGYAENAVAGLDAFFAGPDAAGFDDERRSAYTADIQYTLGLANFQLEEWENAVTAYQAAIAAVPDDPTFYFMLGLASRQSGNVDGFLSAYARAVYLEIPQPEVRTDLETIYQALNGSLEGLDEFIANEGAQIGN